ncbi:hypothetical protein [Bifidobacterium saguinibicoloris]|uniref:hypothetical protein n=1 Tax=Bifidobacterium saguinibicoloris TaxID=2834433 RepID=UPI001C5780B2|nr:hypothetical protein [Bifidobacterium saguinibicoloris]MBW3081587.1 hypothetical protein [Bifidobacterium saguinibicoloris]
MTVSGSSMVVTIVLLLLATIVMPVVAVILIVKLVKRSSAIAGARFKIWYFLLPCGAIFLLSWGYGTFTDGGTVNTVKGLVGMGAGIVLILRCVFEEWRDAAAMQATRRELDRRVDRRIAEETRYSTDMHRAAGVNASDMDKAVVCPSCGSECLLPMGHAILCAACGNPISFAAQATATATGIVGRGVAHDDELLRDGVGVTERDLGTLRQVHAVDGRAIWGDAADVTFRCRRCAATVQGRADRPPACPRCGRPLTVSDIVADRYGATAQVDSARAAAASAVAAGGRVTIVCPTCGAVGSGPLNRPYTCATCGHVIGESDVPRCVPPREGDVR